jgi:hypothetical protein
MEEGIMTGALVAGPALIIDPEEILDELNHRFTKESVEEGGLREKLQEIPRVTSEKAKALSELLLITASHLIEGNHSQLTSKKDRLNQQSQISEYIQYIKEIECRDTKISRYPMEKERELLHLIQTGDSREARRVLNEILGSVFFNSGGKFNVVKTRVLELLVLLSRAAVEGGADAEQIFGMNYKYLEDINNYNSVEDLAGWLARVIVRFSDLVFDLRDVKHGDAIYRTIQYINKHYAEKTRIDLKKRYMLEDGWADSVRQLLLSRDPYDRYVLNMLLMPF